MSIRDWFRGLFAATIRMDDDGDEGAEAEADLSEELPVAAEDAESLGRAEDAGGTSQGSKLRLEFEPKTIAFEGAEAEESERDSEAGQSS
ncbi:MAG TPA: hypothetical protein VKR79_02730 [Gaiellaceae bacterium]|nr:hypothetical protein [Gaiellaceae bacterium]